MKNWLELNYVWLEQALHADRQELLVAYAEHLEFQDLLWGSMDPQAAGICWRLTTELELSMEEPDIILARIHGNMAHLVSASDLGNGCFPDHHDGAGKTANQQKLSTGDHQSARSYAINNTGNSPMKPNSILVLTGENVSDPDLQLTRPFTEMEYHF
jgi:hypothetical protein